MIRQCSRLTVLPLLLAIGACAQLPVGTPFPVSLPSAAEHRGIEDEVHERINDHRAARNLPQLSRSELLDQLAREHSERMATGERSFGHDDFDARAAEARTHLGISRMSENVASNNYPQSSVARQAVAGWLRSPGHLRNLQGEYTLTGVGVAPGAAGDFYITQLFAAR